MTDPHSSGIDPASSPCLVVLCKRPALGHSKQRLAEKVGLRPAFEIAQRLLDCALEDLDHWPGPKALAPDHPRHLAWAQALRPQVQCLAQHDGNLGQRLNDLDYRLRALGQRRLIFIGSDCPALRPRDYRKVAKLLELADTVLLMAQDGGVVLMASNRPWPDLSALPWSTERLGHALADCCQRAGHSVMLAGESFDIDHQEDLEALANFLEQDCRPARLRLRAALRDLGVMPMPASAPISVIIPCWEDEALLGQLLAQLHRLAQSSRQSLQIIVVDAARSQSCREICHRHGAQWLPATPCRGEQLRLGAGHARHSILWFLHADAQLPGNPLPELRAAIGAGAVGGYFAFSFAGPGCWQSRLLERLIAWRNHFGVPYGDQGLFAEASAYHACGQHSPWPLFEEVELVKRLRRLGRFVRLEQGVQVDPRRWQRDGWWRRSLRNRLLALAHAVGVPATRLARLYSQRSATVGPSSKP